MCVQDLNDSNLSAIVTDTYTSDDGNAFKVRKGTGRRMKKHRVKLRGETEKKTKEELETPSDGDKERLEADDHVEVKVQKKKKEILIKYVKETAIDEVTQAKDIVDSSVKDSHSTSEVQEENKDAKVESESDSEVNECQKSNGQVKNEPACPSDSEENHELTETENSSPAENRVVCDVHIQDVSLEVAIDPDRKLEGDTDIIESTDL